MFGIDFRSGRIWLHMINLCIGMSIFVAAFSFTTSIRSGIDAQMAKFGTNLVMLSDRQPFFVPDKQQTLDWTAYELLAERFGAEYDIAPATQFLGPVSDGGRLRQYLSIWEVGPDFFKVLRLAFPEGRPFTAMEDDAGAVGCVFGAQVRDDADEPRIGTSVTVGGTACRLDGIVARTNIAGTWSTGNGVFVSAANLPSAASVLKRPVTQIFLRKKNGGLDPGIGRDIVAVLQNEYDVSRLDTWLASEFWEARKKIIDSVGLLVITIAAVIVGLAAVSLGNGLLLDVAMRRGEIGLRIALGATRPDIFAMIIMEGLAIVACGGGAGIALGFALIHLVIGPLSAQTSLYDQAVSIVIDTSGVIVSLLTLFAVAMVASIVPAYRAAHTEPSVALRDL